MPPGSVVLGLGPPLLRGSRSAASGEGFDKGLGVLVALGDADHRVDCGFVLEVDPAGKADLFESLERGGEVDGAFADDGSGDFFAVDGGVVAFFVRLKIFEVAHVGIGGNFGDAFVSGLVDEEKVSGIWVCAEGIVTSFGANFGDDVVDLVASSGEFAVVF